MMCKQSGTPAGTPLARKPGRQRQARPRAEPSPGHQRTIQDTSGAAVETPVDEAGTLAGMLLGQQKRAGVTGLAQLHIHITRHERGTRLQLGGLSTQVPMHMFEHVAPQASSPQCAVSRRPNTQFVLYPGHALWPEFGRNGVELRRMRAKTRGNFDPTRPLRLGLTKCWPSSTNVGLKPNNFAQIQPSIGQTRPEIRPNRPVVARKQPNLTRHRPTSVRLRPTLARFGPNRARIWLVKQADERVRRQPMRVARPCPCS